jgi:hypothetical protein
MLSRDGMSSWSLMAGIVAVIIAVLTGGVFFIPEIDVCLWFLGPLGLICAVVAIIFGIIGLVAGSGKGMALLGIILGVAYFFMAIIIAVMVVFIDDIADAAFIGPGMF